MPPGRALCDGRHRPAGTRGNPPGEAQAFARVVRLHEEGHFAWRDWAALLADEIARAQRAGDPDLGGTYYHHWLRALERLAAQKGWAAPEDLAARAAALATPAVGDHDHGDGHDHTH